MELTVGAWIQSLAWEPPYTMAAAKKIIKNITRSRPPGYHILGDSTEPRVGMGRELFEVRKGRQQGKQVKKCDHGGREKRSIVAAQG